MRSSQPPRGATWLLERFAPNNDALTGDLAEEYRSGRSSGWYWKEVLSAIVIGFISDIRAHKLLTVRALAIGWATIYVLFRTEGLLTGKYLGFLFSHGIRYDAWWRHYYFYPIILVPLICPWASGWVVARCHRRHERAMVLVYLLSLELWFLPNAFRLTVDTFGDRRFLPFLVEWLVNAALTAVLVLFGGLTGVSRKENTPELT